MYGMWNDKLHNERKATGTKKVAASANTSASGHLQRQGGREGDNKLLDICVIYSEYSAL